MQLEKQLKHIDAHSDGELELEEKSAKQSAQIKLLKTECKELKKHLQHREAQLHDPFYVRMND